MMMMMMSTYHLDVIMMGLAYNLSISLN